MTDEQKAAIAELIRWIWRREPITQWSGDNPRRDVESAVQHALTNIGMEEPPAEEGR